MPALPRLGVRAALRRRLHARVLQQLEHHPAQAARGLSETASDLHAVSTQLGHRLDVLEHALHAQLERARAPTAPFSSGWTMEQVLARHPRAREVLAEHHLPACDRCAVRFDETLAEAAEAYALPLDLLLDQLNALLPERQRPR